MRRVAAGVLAVVVLAALIVSGAMARSGQAATILSGRFEIFHQDLGGGRTRDLPQLVVDGARYDLTGDAVADLRPGSTVRALGTIQRGGLKVDSVSVTAAPKRPVSGNVTSVIVIMAYASEPDDVTPAMIESLLESRDSPWYQQVSKGQIAGIDAHATRWLSVPGGTCGAVDQSLAAAVAAGYDPLAYDRQLIYFPRAACAFEGAAGIGATWSMINGRQALDNGTTIHELGHNYGLFHANKWTCAIGSSFFTLTDDCTHTEYGDENDVMGRSTALGGAGHFGAFNLDLLGWLAQRITDAPKQGGKFEIKPIEVTDRGLQAVRLDDRGTTYWIFYRQPIGVDAYMSRTPGATSGLTIQLDGAPHGNPGSLVLDMTPDGDFSDVTLRAGSTWISPSGDYRIEVGAVGSRSATFRIRHVACLVQNTRTGAGFPDLQAAQDVATSGDTLTVKGTCGAVVVRRSLTIKGVLSTGYGAPTLSASARVLAVAAGIDVAIDHIAITGGVSGGGGGIFNEGRLALDHVTVSDNTGGFGGGIVNFGALTLTSSTVVANRAIGGRGGGIFNWGDLALRDTTVSGNTATGGGGGIFNVEDPDDPSTLTFAGTNTITANTPDDTASGPS